jgi:hypothetical protein
MLKKDTIAKDATNPAFMTHLHRFGVNTAMNHLPTARRRQGQGRFRVLKRGPGAALASIFRNLTTVGSSC